jgi:Predicted nucleotide-binding protein containing TIR-like domain
MTDALDPSLFIGCSSEANSVAQALQAELDTVCEPTIWYQGVFGPGSVTMSALVDEARRVDYAVLILTPDDIKISRGAASASARDNAILELGLFLGSLGPDRVFMVTPRESDLRLPTDLAGVTTLQYKPDRKDGNLRAALGPTALAIQQRIARRGLRPVRHLDAPAVAMASAARRGLTTAEEQEELDRELSAITKAARSQGWEVKTHSDTAFRLVSRNGQRYSLALGSPAETRDRLRAYAGQLRDAGLRVSQLVLTPVGAEVPTAKPGHEKEPARPVSRRPPPGTGQSERSQRREPSSVNAPAKTVSRRTRSRRS